MMRGGAGWSRECWARNASITSSSAAPSAFEGKKLRSPTCRPPRIITRLTHATAPSMAQATTSASTPRLDSTYWRAWMRERAHLVAVGGRLLVAPRLRGGVHLLAQVADDVVFAALEEQRRVAHVLGVGLGRDLAGARRGA